MPKRFCSVLFNQNMIEPIVCVPARNESKRLPALLRSLQQQTWLRVNNRSLQTVLVLNNCDDNSRAVVQRSAPDLPGVSLHLIEVQFASENAHVGSARRLAMETAFALAPNNSVLLTTDADAIPRHDWVEANLRAIASGADLVGGHIVGNKQEEALLGPRFVRRAARHLYYAKLVDRLTSLVDPLPHDPWPRHSDHTGASLAVRSEVYAAVGGMPALPFREDVAFVERVRRAGYRLRHPLPHVKLLRSLEDCRDLLAAAQAGQRNRPPKAVDVAHAVLSQPQGLQLSPFTTSDRRPEIGADPPNAKKPRRNETHDPSMRHDGSRPMR